MYKKIIKILTNKEKKTLYKLVAMMFIGAILDLMSVGIFVPVIYIISEGKLDNLVIFKQYANLDKNMLIVIASCILMIVYLVKATFLTYLSYKKNKFMYDVRGNLSFRLYGVYINSTWEDHIKSNSSGKINTLTNETNQFGTGVIYPLLTLYTEIMVAFAFFIFMFFYHMAETIIIIILAIVVAKLYKIKVKDKLTEWGNKRKYFESERILQVQQALGGLKEVKLFGRQSYFESKYINANKNIIQVMTKQGTFQQIPVIWFEMLAITSLVALVIYMTINGESLLNTTATIAVFGGSAIRLMPTFSRIAISLQSLKFNSSVVEHIAEELNAQYKSINIKEVSEIKFEKSISVKNMFFEYEGAGEITLKNINIDINKNQFVGIVGESGAGKSTLVDVMLGLLKPTSGTVCVDDNEILDHIKGWQKIIGYVPQNIYLLDDTLRRNIAYGIEDEDVDELKLINAVKYASLDNYIKGLRNGLNEIVGERGARISGGQRQRIGIARALYNDPKIIVLDEATSALDSETEKEIMNTVSLWKNKKTVILITHNQDNLRYCDKIYTMQHGEIKLH